MPRESSRCYRPVLLITDAALTAIRKIKASGVASVNGIARELAARQPDLSGYPVLPRFA
jgi:hypothetical protein